MVKSNPGIFEAVKKYNSLLSELRDQFDFIDTVTFEHQAVSFFEDGYHLSKIGNRQLFDSLKENLSQLCR